MRREVHPCEQRLAAAAKAAKAAVRERTNAAHAHKQPLHPLWRPEQHCIDANSPFSHPWPSCSSCRARQSQRGQHPACERMRAHNMMVCSGKFLVCVVPYVKWLLCEWGKRCRRMHSNWRSAGLPLCPLAVSLQTTAAPNAPQRCERGTVLISLHSCRSCDPVCADYTRTSGAVAPTLHPLLRRP